VRGQEPHVRAVGALLAAAALIVGGVGALWTIFALVGREWDYCPRGSDCIPGELVGLLLVAGAAIAGWLALRLVKRN
jgi:hypothetical protein